MDEVQEQTLVRYFHKAKAELKKLMYLYDGECKEIVAIETGPTPQEGDVPEPSLCAYFQDGTYVALYNCDMTDFVIVERLK